MSVSDSPLRSAFATTKSVRPSGLAKLIVLLGFTALAAVVAVYVWIDLIRVPLERPVGPLFGSGPPSMQGWAPWYVAPVFAAALTIAILYLYFRRAHRW